MVVLVLVMLVVLVVLALVLVVAEAVAAVVLVVVVVVLGVVALVLRLCGARTHKMPSAFFPATSSDDTRRGGQLIHGHARRPCLPGPTRWRSPPPPLLSSGVLSPLVFFFRALSSL